MSKPTQATVSAWPTVRSRIPRDPAIEDAVSALLRRMSLPQKVGQMVQPEILAVTPAEVKAFHIGSVLNGGGSWPGKRMDASAGDWAALADAYYDASVDTSGGEPDAFLPIPILWGTDAVHGHSNVRGATLFPHNIGLGCARDPELIRRIGHITAKEVAATGLDWTFAPTLAVIRDDRWGRTYESYAEDPAVVRAYAGALVEGIQGEAGTPGLLDDTRVLACAKHFLGDGGTTGGVDQGDTEVDEAALIALHAQGYLSALAAGAQTVMVSFSSWNGRKMHGNGTLVTEVLRGPLGFDGLVVGDWNGHGQVPGCANDSCPHVINAGVDLIMVPFDWKALIQNTLAQVASGEISEARIDEAVTRILRVKMRAGLLGPRTTKGRPSTRALAGDATVLGRADHRAVAREAVQKSLVLLKNRDGLVPLSPGAKVLVVGKSAHDIGLQSGGWTLTWQGTETQRSDFPAAQTIFEGIAETVEAAGGTAVLSTDGAEADSSFDAVIAVLGETPYAEGQGDLQPPDTLAHVARYPEDCAVLNRVRSQAPTVPVVTVLLTGRPVWVNPELNRSDAFLVAWLPGGEGGGVADGLFGATPLTGRLSMSWPRVETDYTLHPEDTERALFPYGFGLEGGQISDPGPLSEERHAHQGSGSWDLFTRGSARSGCVLELTAASGRVDPGTQGRTPGGELRLQTIDGGLQNSAKRLNWAGPGSFAIRCDGRLPGGSGVLRLSVRLHQLGAGRITLSGEDITQALHALGPGDWHPLELPLDGLDTARPLILAAAAGTCLDVEDVRWEPRL